MEIILAWVFAGVVFGVIGGVITEKKNRGFAAGFLLCMFLGCIGLVIAVVLTPVAAPATAPTGFQAVRCQRCNAEQNVPVGVSDPECWQCHSLIALSVMATSTPGRPPQLSDAPTLAAARDLFPNGHLPPNPRVQVIKAGDPNFGKVGTVDQYQDGIACVRFTIFGRQFPYALEELQPRG